MRRGAAAFLLLGAGLAAACAGPSPVPTAGLPAETTPPREEPFFARPLRPFRGDRWIGQGIAYGPYRDGQRPGGPSPTRAEIRQDLEILRGRWGLVGLYGADETAADVLALSARSGCP